MFGDPPLKRNILFDSKLLLISTQNFEVNDISLNNSLI
jgi:hypothetical protein